LDNSNVEDDLASERAVIGIDLGGTKISTALLDSAGKIIAHDHRKTHATEGPRVVIGRMVDTARGVMAQAGVERSFIHLSLIIDTGGV
jgi:glucokinase